MRSEGWDIKPTTPAEKVITEEMSQEDFEQWERAMQKLFKGILPRPERHAALRRALAARQKR